MHAQTPRSLLDVDESTGVAQATDNMHSLAPQASGGHTGIAINKFHSAEPLGAAGGEIHSPIPSEKAQSILNKIGLMSFPSLSVASNLHISSIPTPMLAPEVRYD